MNICVPYIPVLVQMSSVISYNKTLFFSSKNVFSLKMAVFVSNITKYDNKLLCNRVQQSANNFKVPPERSDDKQNYIAIYRLNRPKGQFCDKGDSPPPA